MARVRFGDVPADEERSEYERWAPGTYQKMVPLDNLHEHPDNWDLVGRIDDSKRGSLKEDISRSGIREPLQVWLHDGQLVVVSGHERLAIARELGIKELPCMKVDFRTELEARQHIYATNANRKTVKRPAEQLLVELFPPEEYPLLYADLRANYSYGDVERSTFLSEGESGAGDVNAFPSNKDGSDGKRDGERNGVRSLAEKRAEKREARERRERERKDQARLRKKVQKTLGLTAGSARKTINRVAAKRSRESARAAKPRELTPEEKKKRDALDKKLTVLRDRIEKKDVQFERLREDLRELRGEERRIVRMLEKFGQPELFE